MKQVVRQLFDDLGEYKEFCRIYGRVFNERHLYNTRSPYNDFLKWKESGKVRWWPGYWDDRKPRQYNNKHKHYNKQN